MAKKPPKDKILEEVEEVVEVREMTDEDRLRILKSNLLFLEGELRNADTEVGKEVIREWITAKKQEITSFVKKG